MVAFTERFRTTPTHRSERGGMEADEAQDLYNKLRPWQNMPLTATRPEEQEELDKKRLEAARTFISYAETRHGISFAPKKKECPPDKTWIGDALFGDKTQTKELIAIAESR